MSKAKLLAGYALTAALALAAGGLAWHWLGGGRPAAEAPVYDRERFFALSLPDLDGRNQALAQWRGKVLVVNYWAAWCPPCREEMPMFVKVHEAYRDRGVVFLGIALDRREPVAAFADEVGVNYPVLLGGVAGLDLMKQTGNRLGGLPYTVILDRQGNIATQATGALTRERLEAALKPLL